ELDLPQAFDRVFDQRQLGMRVRTRVPMSGKVLSTCCDAFLLQGADDCGAQAPDDIRLLRQSPIADHWILWIRMNVQNGCVIERDANGLPRRRQPPPETFREGCIAAPAEGSPRWPDGKGRFQARDATALLIDAHP